MLLSRPHVSILSTSADMESGPREHISRVVKYLQKSVKDILERIAYQNSPSSSKVRPMSFFSSAEIRLHSPGLVTPRPLPLRLVTPWVSHSHYRKV
ncbi:hypothetical protein EB796_011736 [Bugula neritina]|uniref:Uncharacterized protein n=1 Tax=Bugula neritina TaxID=10212 RepID=A0A7J7JX88_BUGNE|nr:hypothetical protein EB796_011736 [Bugula neritina]